MKECFNKFDSNGDGYISMMEFVEVKTAFERKNEEKIPLLRLKILDIGRTERNHSVLM